MRLSPIIPFGAWEPDVPPLGSKSATEIINAAPVAGGYAPVKELVVSGALGPGDPTAAIGRTVASVGISESDKYIATNAGLFGNGALIFAAAGQKWIFERWGSDIVAGCALGIFRISGVTVVPLAAPGATFIKRVKDFLVAGLASNPSYIQWSAFNDIESFAPSKTTQSDLNDMGVEFGAVMGIAGIEAPYVLQERSISKMGYAGPPVVFAFQRLSDHKGCVSRGSIITTPFGSGFFSQDGPNVILGDEIRPIAKGRFQRWFADNFDPSWPVNAGYDWREKTILWTWNEGLRRKGLVYSPAEDRASLLDNPPAAYLNDGDNLFGVDFTGRIGTFTGVNARASLTTGESQMEPQRRSFVSEIWPVVDAAAKSANVGTRDGQSIVYSPEYEANGAGMVHCRSSAKEHRFKVTIPRGEPWNFAQGVQIGFRPEGRQ